ncbi:amino acid deaminase/aldolase [Phytohabitans rumicis]|uniref:Alanine racemase n=1 Tax=Phytohabitans rumicis TaxID=1076125 RepID=A0A6V8L5I3_9ACTN|nr:amino acid deaminase/aldolase [Phytohabitans rumicis]GFJ90081.1 alanine racemase [Phytohabitans rumicis]
MTTERDALRERLDKATADFDPPFAVVDVAAFDANAASIVRRAAGKPVRVASKSVRCRALVTRALATPGWHGVMSFTLAEAIWLMRSGVTTDALVAYPTADRGALRELAADADLAAAITLMVDAPAQLDLIDSAAPPDHRAELRLCLELDGSWRPFGVHIGVRRSPLHSPAAVGALAATIAGRRGFRLVGLMAYDAQIAGLGDAPPRQALRGAAIRAMQRRSYLDLLSRRGQALAAVREHADVEFFNSGGTGSVAATVADPAVTEVTAGSGLYGPALFDEYRSWHPAPAAFFALAVVRRPTASLATVSGGGWIASGQSVNNRQPVPWLPEGLRLVRAEGAGEVQTPVRGPGAAVLRVGDRVWFRHAKAGELCEHVNELHLVDGDRVVDTVPTYRGEGHAFL